MSRITYFDENGSFGEIDDLIFIDTSKFTNEDWFALQCVENIHEAAFALAMKYESHVFIPHLVEGADACKDS